ncbi:HEAT repeat domain-containing protein [Bradyrhizobium sp. BWA-3-5]|uniref:HEAT repeat domain-containing protein n=1 Tax=Bradyrhizobium sp. BWA-3-5 TaxID=3080013 RepID=UPI00293EC98A|nr:HEAT repeat domain-containing protein [Bradyrhizobium sp. BWA-3-5]WOH64298.1 HEAT repeat domain-containing protein [Bradyrhizobium sp. BWA-3-5]
MAGESAGSTIGRIGQVSAAAALITSLSDNCWQVRQKALQSLAKLRARLVVDAIIPFLGDGLPWLRKDAAAALGEIADPKARDALLTPRRTKIPICGKPWCGRSDRLRTAASP